MNVLEYGKVFQEKLDEAARHELLTGWMDANAGQVKYEGGNEIKIPQLSTDGLADYGRAGNTGFVAGGVKLKFETKTMTQDRGRRFVLDANDIDETNFVATTGNVLGEFQRSHVVPEVDAYRISKLASEAAEGNVKEGYTPKEDTIVRELKEGVKAIRATGYNGDLVIHISYDALLELELFFGGRLTNETFSINGVDTEIPTFDSIPLIATPDNRMYTSIQLLDGKTEGQEAGGYAKGEEAKEINFLIVAKTTPIAVSKQDKMRIFDPSTFQDADAYALDYRRYHDVWVKNNKADSIFVNVK